MSVLVLVPFADLSAASPVATGHVKYFGFYGQRIYSDSVVSGFVNVSFASPPSLANPLSLVEHHKSYGINSIYTVDSVFFWDDYFSPSGKSTTLDPNYEAKWAAFAPTIASRVNDGSIVAFYLYDEAYGNLEQGTATRPAISRHEAYLQLQNAARAIKSTFPNTPIYVLEDRLHLNVDPSAGPYLFPPEIDWIGFDCYLGTFESCAFEGYGIQHYFNQLKTGLAPNQKIVLLPQTAAYATTGSAADQAQLLSLFDQYVNLAKSDSKVVAVLGFTAENFGPFDDGKRFWGALEESWGSLSNLTFRETLLAKGLAMLVPPSVSINKSSVVAGENIGVSWANIPSPKPKDWIVLATPATPNNIPVEWVYVSCTRTSGSASKQGSCDFKIPEGVTPGTYEFRLFENNDYNRLAVSPTFTVKAAVSAHAYPAPNIYATPAVSGGGSGGTTSAGTTVAINTPASFSLRSTLLFNSRGSEVSALQNILISKGYLTAGSNTGYFGALTRAAVRKYQCDKGIVCSGDEKTTGYGVVGVRTRASLSGSVPSAPSGVQPTPVLTSQPIQQTTGRNLYLGMRGTDVLDIQNILIAFGYLPFGSNTGYFGEQTRNAVRKYQCAKGIVCSGDESTTGYGVVGAKTRASFLVR